MICVRRRESSSVGLLCFSVVTVRAGRTDLGVVEALDATYLGGHDGVAQGARLRRRQPQGASVQQVLRRPTLKIHAPSQKKTKQQFGVPRKKK